LGVEAPGLRLEIVAKDYDNLAYATAFVTLAASQFALRRLARI
jgi:hypothetical protein